MSRKNNHISIDPTIPPVDISISSTPNKTSPSDISTRSSFSGPSHIEISAFCPSLLTMNEQADSAPNVKMEDLVETKVVVTEAVQALYEQEKLLIVLNKKPSAFSGCIKSSIWKNVYHIDWAEMHRLIKLCHFDLSKYKGIAAIADVLKNPKYKKDIASKNFAPFYRRAVICPYCWVDKNTPLATAFIVLSNKSTSNYHAHMKRLHPDIPLEDEGTVSSKHSITGEVSTSSKTAVGVKAEPIDLVEDGPLDRFANKDPMTKAGARKAVQRAIYECINDLGFPSSTVEKPVFRALPSLFLTKISK